MQEVKGDLTKTMLAEDVEAGMFHGVVMAGWCSAQTCMADVQDLEAPTVKSWTG